MNSQENAVPKAATSVKSSHRERVARLGREARRELAPAEAYPSVALADCDSSEILEALLSVIGGAICCGETVTWGRLAREMKTLTSMRWDADKYFTLRTAVRALTARMADHTGHIISVAVLSTTGENSQFFKDAALLNLLPNTSKQPARKRFWVTEWDWWEAWGKRAETDPESVACSKWLAACDDIVAPDVTRDHQVGRSPIRMEISQ